LVLRLNSTRLGSARSAPLISSPNQRHSMSQQRSISLASQHHDTNHNMEKSPGLPPVEEEEMGVMGLTEVDPSPVDTPEELKVNQYFPVPDEERPEKETEEMRGIRRMNTLGLRLGDHGPAWWRTSSYNPLACSWNADTSPQSSAYKSTPPTPSQPSPPST